MKNEDLRAAGEALEAMGFELISEDEDGLLEYWQPSPPFEKVVLQNNPWNERATIISALARHIDIERFLQLTGWGLA